MFSFSLFINPSIWIHLKKEPTWWTIYLQNNDVNKQPDSTTFSFINLFNSALHVSCDKFVHPQEHFWLYIHLVGYLHRCTKMMHGNTNIIFSMFRQTHLHVSGIYTAHHQEVHRMDTKVDTYSFEMTDSCPDLVASQDNRQSCKRTIISNYCIHTVYLLMMGCRYARNM